jgi:hypothetical protein
MAKKCDIKFFGQNRGDGKAKTDKGMKVTQTKGKTSMKLTGAHDKVTDGTRGGAGKGDTPRSCHSVQYRENYDKIFGKRKGKKKLGKYVKKY